MMEFLHVGCGLKHKTSTTPGFDTPDWREIRLDIDPSVAPDIMADIRDLQPVPSGSVDAVFSSHNLEHLHPHEAHAALMAFRRVLKPGGFVIVTCPDLRAVARLVLEKGLLETAYVSAAGPIAPIDMLFGHRASLATGHVHMAHKGGFTLKALIGTLEAAGFARIAGVERNRYFDLWVAAARDDIGVDGARALLARHLPR